MCWCGYLSATNDLHMVQLIDITATPSSLVSLNQTGLTFLVPAYPGCLRKEAIKCIRTLTDGTIKKETVCEVGCECCVLTKSTGR